MTLNERILSVQHELATIVATRDNEFSNSKFAALVDYTEALRPLLKKYGLGVIQVPTVTRENPEWLVTVTTTVFCADDEKVYPGLTIPLSEKADKMNRIQKVGASITYARRYELGSIFFMASEEEDTDGNVAEPTRREEAAPDNQGLLESLRDELMTIVQGPGFTGEDVENVKKKMIGASEGKLRYLIGRANLRKGGAE